MEKDVLNDLIQARHCPCYHLWLFGIQSHKHFRLLISFTFSTGGINLPQPLRLHSLLPHTYSIALHPSSLSQPSLIPEPCPLVKERHPFSSFHQPNPEIPGTHLELLSPLYCTIAKTASIPFSCATAFASRLHFFLTSSALQQGCRGYLQQCSIRDERAKEWICV